MVLKLKRFHFLTVISFFLFSFINPDSILANSSAYHLDGSVLPSFWTIPFVGMLLSIAFFPLIIPKLWERHYGKVSFFWALAFLIPCTIFINFETAFYSFLETALTDYFPFIILLLGLFTVTGGIRLKGTLIGTPLINVSILAFGTIIASFIGTTGAAMLLIRPILRANDHRKYKVHTIVFFIFLVANIGGSLTPLGDPPLFLGFLRGVNFFWTTKFLFIPYLFMSLSLLSIYFILDSYYYSKEGKPKSNQEKEKIGLEGKYNFIFILVILMAVFMSGAWKPDLSPINIYKDISLTIPNILRDILILLAALSSYKLTSKEIHDNNEFTWAPIIEVAKIFAGIFASMIPALAILAAGEKGALKGVIAMVSTADGTPHPGMYFWVSGILSSFLDNAPTYLVFFNIAGGDPIALMTKYSHVLVAISCGAVFMGANTYIGNAPNFMLRSIAEEQGIKMPSFFGYMIWPIIFLIPLYIILNIFFI